MKIDVADGNKKLVSYIRTLVPVGDDISRLYEMRLTIEGGNRPVGHAARVVVPTSNTRSVTAVPRDALVIQKDAIKVVGVTPENVVEIVAISTGAATSYLIEVIGDIKPEDNVVIRSNERI